MRNGFELLNNCNADRKSRKEKMAIFDGESVCKGKWQKNKRSCGRSLGAHELWIRALSSGDFGYWSEKDEKKSK
jgi:acyl-CoA synthetase (AMP-forming)/AMP-acid ligase II